ncbi:MAG TPA: phytanoyl-CoA dioxygenase family protein [Myxococcota bacterium]|nr:phytanoyl-CoA dioxygenase family protein [Myxococcota bacterium]
MLTSEQLHEFEQTGITQLRGAIAPTAVATMRKALWAELASAHGVRENDRDTWRVAGRPSGFQSLAKRGVFGAMASPTVRAALDDLFGERGWDEPARWGQPLVCFGQPEDWDVPRDHWHLDFAGDPREPLVAVRVFAFLAPLESHGGATLALAGSHRLVRRLCERAGSALRSADAREQLAALDPWLAALESDEGDGRVVRFMEAATLVDGVPLRVVEVRGEAGDVALMRTDVLHAMSSNVRDVPRLVVGQFVTRRGMLRPSEFA